ncbi:alpha/beta hydrolase [Clostridium folliculivorans]|uniref:AB hydrolase-1 domain-containing protein n=1 Tax=Clostridium folliculivorans TaxID=2886038 RepID=A0A9W6D7V9_9CLOT|nr:alpha/beta hydrolase [Clostridium folliculivorans]GKU23189.1 hypothetical protein CFOLD11_00150 [Clostridium folliculivorans]GKU29235.1 hypothetical protein CFB3_13410 [Clostridium folliculivorans]
MSFIPYSNSFHKINLKDPIKPFKIFKIFVYLLLAVLLFGFIYKTIDTKIMDSKIKPKGKYVRIDGEKFSYDVYGSGDYTVILDGDVGLDMSQWRNVVNGLNNGFDGSVFMYDREGYGFNDSGSKKTIEDQARDLKLVLKKAGVSGPYILVGEGYGSLVMTNFAKIFPQNIAGMVLIDPINEKTLSDAKSIKKYSSILTKEKVLHVGSYIGLTNLLDKFNLLKDNKSFLDELSSYDKDEFAYHRLGRNYNGAYKNELNNLVNGKSNSQDQGLIQDKPLSLVINANGDVNMQKELSKLSKIDLIDLKTVNNKDKVTSQTNSDIVIDQIKAVAKKYKQIKKLQDQNNKK